MGNVILVASGKGGVGKTTFTANLAASLASVGKTVLAMDADLYLSNLDTVAGIREFTLFDLQDMYRGQISAEKAILRHPTVQGLSFLCAPSRLSEDGTALLQFLKQTAVAQKNFYDFVLIDCPAGTGQTLEILADRTFDALMVATPDMTSVHDAERAAEHLRAHGIRSIRLVVNRVIPNMMKNGTAPDVDTMIDGTVLQLIGLIPADLRAVSAGNAGELLMETAPRTRLAKAYLNIARRIAGVPVELLSF